MDIVYIRCSIQIRSYRNSNVIMIVHIIMLVVPSYYININVSAWSWYKHWIMITIHWHKYFSSFQFCLSSQQFPYYQSIDHCYYLYYTCRLKCDGKTTNIIWITRQSFRNSSSSCGENITSIYTRDPTACSYMCMAGLGCIYK